MLMLWKFYAVGSIREWIGDFSRIKNVAKYANAFSSSTETTRVSGTEIEIILDVDNKTKYVFSDGIGKISLELARRVAKKCDYDSMPSAFQIRLL